MVKHFLGVGGIVLTPFKFFIGRGSSASEGTVGPKDMVGIYRDGLLEIREKREMQGLYQKARAGCLASVAHFLLGGLLRDRVCLS